MYDSVHYGRLIRDLREKAKMTIEEAAEKYELSMTGLVKIEFGDSDPKLSTIIRIAKVLEMDLGDLNYCIKSINLTGGATTMEKYMLTSTIYYGEKEYIFYGIAYVKESNNQLEILEEQHTLSDDMNKIKNMINILNMTD